MKRHGYEFISVSFVFMADRKLNRNSRSFVRERTENRLLNTLNMTSSEIMTNGTTFAMRGECDGRDFKDG